MATNRAPNLVTKPDARRSTRISQAVPVIISIHNEMGISFLESTSTLSMNCHGCLYPSKNEYQPGSWITLDVTQQADRKPHCVRAQVRFIRPSPNPSEPYHVGVELQTPANVWGVPMPPEDWLQFSATTTALATPSEPAPPHPDALASWTMRSTPDEVRGTLDAKLQRAAEKAVSGVVASQSRRCRQRSAEDPFRPSAKRTVRDAEQVPLLDLPGKVGLLPRENKLRGFFGGRARNRAAP